MQKVLPLVGFSAVVSPRMTPSFADHSRGSPSHSERSLPLKMETMSAGTSGAVTLAGWGGSGAGGHGVAGAQGGEGLEIDIGRGAAGGFGPHRAGTVGEDLRGVVSAPGHVAGRAGGLGAQGGEIPDVLGDVGRERGF